MAARALTGLLFVFVATCLSSLLDGPRLGAYAGPSAGVSAKIADVIR